MPSALQAIALDYDGTLAIGPRPEPDVLEGISAARSAGRVVVLVTGRILSELRADFPGVDGAFDAIVAENGAVIADHDGVRDLAAPVDPVLGAALAHRDVPLRQGRVVLACDAVHANTALEEIGRLQLDCQLARNRAALMVLPGGVTKGLGLVEALRDLGISPHSTVAVGDAENDIALLETCELGVAVANAVDSLKERADLVLDAADGQGVAQLLDGPIISGAARLPPRRWRLELGVTPGGHRVDVPASQINLLITGGSGAGKSYLAGLLAEQLVRLRYSVLVLDREGDHVDLAAREGVLALGGRDGLPTPRELTQVLGNRFGSAVVDMSLLDEEATERYLRGTLPGVLAQRALHGVPHWLFLEEAHGFLDDPDLRAQIQASGTTGYCTITYRPDELGRAFRHRIDRVVLAAGDGIGADDAVAYAARTTGHDPAELASSLGTRRGEALLVTADGPAVAFAASARSTSHVRHWHKYVVGTLPPELRFRLDGTDQDAANLRELHRLLGSCAEARLVAHSRRGDFSRWVEDVFQDLELGEALRGIEAACREGAGPRQARGQLRQAIEERYLE